MAKKSLFADYQSEVYDFTKAGKLISLSPEEIHLYIKVGFLKPSFEDKFTEEDIASILFFDKSQEFRKHASAILLRIPRKIVKKIAIESFDVRYGGGEDTFSVDGESVGKDSHKPSLKPCKSFPAKKVSEAHNSKAKLIQLPYTLPRFNLSKDEKRDYLHIDDLLGLVEVDWSSDSEQFRFSLTQSRKIKSRLKEYKNLVNLLYIIKGQSYQYKPTAKFLNAVETALNSNEIFNGKIPRGRITIKNHPANKNTPGYHHHRKI